LQLVGQLVELLPRAAQSLLVVAEHAFGRLFHSFSQLADAAASDFFLLPRIVGQSAPHRQLGRFQRTIEVPFVGVANGVLKLLGEQRLGGFRLLHRLAHLVQQFLEPLFLLGQFTRNLVAAIVAA
jgi:hypothetical protein